MSLLRAIKQQLMGRVWLDPVTKAPLWGDVHLQAKAGRIVLVRVTGQYHPETLEAVTDDGSPQIRPASAQSASPEP